MSDECDDLVILDSEEELNYPETYYLPVLYTKDKSEKERLWKVWVDGDTVHRIQGLVDGKKQTYKRTFTGKNIGKKNETSPHEQSMQESETLWIKQIDKGYYPKCAEGKKLLQKIKKSQIGGHNINASASIRGRDEKKITEKKSLVVDEVKFNVKPMKAGVWEHAPDNPRDVLPKTLKYFDMAKGFYMQYKLDGWRCIARLQKKSSGEDYDIVLTTNNQKQFPWFAKLRNSIKKAVVDYCKKVELIPENFILDGELYSHVLFDENGQELNDEVRFSTISSMCGLARTSPHPLEDQIKFVVFDIAEFHFDQDERMEELKTFFKQSSKKDTENILMCNTEIGYTVDDVIEYHEKAYQEGYEGVIIRSRKLKYIEKRSLYIRKYKRFIDREYTLVGINKDKGVGDEYFSWICQDPEIIDPKTGKLREFSATPKADAPTKKDWYINYPDYIGKKACIRFQEYSNDGVPRFPRMVGIREDQ